MAITQLQTIQIGTPRPELDLLEQSHCGAVCTYMACLVLRDSEGLSALNVAGFNVVALSLPGYELRHTHRRKDSISYSMRRSSISLR